MTTLLTMKGFNKKHTPGIYMKSGVISLSSNGKNWITIAEKKLGATGRYNEGDTLSQQKCGNYYQWGNNYGFPFSGSVSTSSTQVNASNYGPGNYYNSSTFIKGVGNWDSSGNNNLWGDTTNTLIARRGPCAEGYHVPTTTEWESVISILNNLGNPNASTYLKIPYAGVLYGAEATIGRRDTHAYLWASNVYSSGEEVYSDYGVCVYIYNGVLHSFADGKTQGFNIRPFKNTPVVPDDSRTVLYPTN